MRRTAIRRLAAACAALAFLVPARSAGQDPSREAEPPPFPPEVDLSEPRLVPAEAPRAPRFRVALGAGWSMPWGDATAGDGDTFTRVVSRAVPLRVEASLALDRRDEVGLFVAYGLAGAGAEAASCDGGFDCSARDLRLGVVARHVFAAESPLAPSLALLFGWESARLEVEGPGGNVVHGRRGLFAGVEGTAERRIRGALRAGPYVALLAGQFGEARRATEDWVDVRGRALHGWIELGLRASYGL